MKNNPYAFAVGTSFNDRDNFTTRSLVLNSTLISKMSKEIVGQLLEAGGLELGKDFIVHDERFYDRVVSEGTLGLGEAYMDGWWSAGELTLDQLSHRVNSTNLNKKLKELSWGLKFKLFLVWLEKNFCPPSTVEDSKVVAEKHYDLGNELYSHMLGFPMIYSCGYFRNAKGLPSAQMDKMELISRKIRVSGNADADPHLGASNNTKRVLEIGCGWGDLAMYLARSGAMVEAITISQEQYNFCLEHRKHPNLQFHLMDYREFKPNYKFDAIVSVGMFEHVNPNNYLEFMKICSDLLSEKGIMLLHTIGKNISEINSDPWISKYIFPNSTLPSLTQIIEASEGLFVTEDVHNFGPYYDQTLMAWYENFKSKFYEINESRIKQGKEVLDTRFYRMWEYYLLTCAGLFRARKTQLYQVVFSKSLSLYVRPHY